MARVSRNSREGRAGVELSGDPQSLLREPILTGVGPKIGGKTRNSTSARDSE